MLRADRLTLDATGLNMPPVDHMSNNAMLNVLLDRTFSGLPSGLPPDPTLVGLFTNFVRLTDKALREYDASRAELMSYVAPHETLATSAYLRAIDHMENCVSATHRSVLNARALRRQEVGRKGPQLTQRQEQRLRYFRNAIEHSDERILEPRKSLSRPPFRSGEPYSLRPANKSMVIGEHVLTYAELVSAMAKCYLTIEAIRGVPTGVPGPNWPNALLRTKVSQPPAQEGSMRPSKYLQELSRLAVTH